MLSSTVFALLGVASATTVPLHGRQGATRAVCETTDGSPLTEDVTEMINNMKDEKNKWGLFCVVGSFGNDCTPTIRAFSNGNSAAFQMCGAGGGGRFRCAQGTGPGVCFNCPGLVAGAIAEYLTALQQQCQKGGRVGGYYDWDDGDLKIIHS
ncbi:hypothetical protein NM208_g2577 [Fusarium decemcellulare]|uniref:Uncharacterized protein n=1 Tax=Fusarium decemcellulare TaxID=57161 RepID=A0ACC1SRY7_9HYPO|nr:hypothetical protein NM208_g2577 [Fusarium decemcellulare]